MLINVKMPTIVGILTFMSKIYFVISLVEHTKKFYNLGSWSVVFDCGISLPYPLAFSRDATGALTCFQANDCVLILSVYLFMS